MKYPIKPLYLKDPEARRIVESLPKGEASQIICDAIVAHLSDNAQEAAKARLKIAFRAIAEDEKTNALP